MNRRLIVLVVAFMALPLIAPAAVAENAVIQKYFTLFKSQQGDPYTEYYPIEVTRPGEITVSVKVNRLDPDPTEPVRYEQDHGLFSYAGIWYTSTGSSFSGGSYRYASRSESSVTATFTGTAVSYIATTANMMGQARVTLDGGTPFYVDLFSLTTAHQQTVWSTSGLTNTVHTLLIEYSGLKNPSSRGYYVDLDALDITGTLIATTSAPAESGAWSPQILQ